MFFVLVGFGVVILAGLYLYRILVGIIDHWLGD
jgi:hypothetical protein